MPFYTIASWPVPEPVSDSPPSPPPQLISQQVPNYPPESDSTQDISTSLSAGVQLSLYKSPDCPGTGTCFLPHFLYDNLRTATTTAQARKSSLLNQFFETGFAGDHSVCIRANLSYRVRPSERKKASS